MLRSGASFHEGRFSPPTVGLRPQGWRCVMPMVSPHGISYVGVDGAVSDRGLEMALRDIANIIKLHGPRYMPIFERLANELTDRSSRKKAFLEIVASAELPMIDLQPMTIDSGTK